MSNTNIPIYESHVPVLGPLSAGNSLANTWPTHDAKLGAGGFEVVANLSELNAITPERRKDKLVLVRNTGAGHHGFYVEEGGSFVKIDLGTGGSTPPSDLHFYYFGFNDTDAGMTDAEIKSNGVGKKTEVIDKVWIELRRNEDSEKYMWVWVPNTFGDVKGFEFSGFLSVWDKIFDVTVDGEAGKLYISPNPTHAQSVDFQIIQ